MYVESKYYSLEGLLNYLSKSNTARYLFFWSDKSVNTYIDKSCLSQWFISPFEVNGVEYPTAEHYMMAQKAILFNDGEAYEKILHSNHPGEAKQLGRDIENFDQKLWDDKKLDIVINGNYAKFTSSLLLKNYLLSTSDKVLVEASPVDCVWGIGLSEKDSFVYEPQKWKGLNMLGFALMTVRNNLGKEIVS